MNPVLQASGRAGVVPQVHLRWTRRLVLFIGVVFLLAVSARLLLPTMLERYVNRTLDRLEHYTGHVESISVHLYRGAYQIHGLKILKREGRVPVPFFRANVVDLSVQWGALLRGKVVGEVVADRAQLNFVNARTAGGQQTETDDDWLAVLKDLFPLRINRAELVESEIHFRDFESSPQVNVEMDHIHAIGTNFSNTRRPSEGLVAAIQASAAVQGRGRFTLHSQIHPSSPKPTFDLDAELTGLPVTALNDFLRAYLGIEAKAGEVGFFTEMASRQARVRGYVKPIVRDLDIFQLPDLLKNPLRGVWEAVVGTFAELFSNHRHDQVAAEVPFEGDLDAPEIGVWSSLGSLLKNAFVRALQPRLGNKISLESVNKDRAHE